MLKEINKHVHVHKTNGRIPARGDFLFPFRWAGWSATRTSPMARCCKAAPPCCSRASLSAPLTLANGGGYVPRTFAFKLCARQDQLCSVGSACPDGNLGAAGKLSCVGLGPGEKKIYGRQKVSLVSGWVLLKGYARQENCLMSDWLLVKKSMDGRKFLLCGVGKGWGLVKGCVCKDLLCRIRFWWKVVHGRVSSLLSGWVLVENCTRQGQLASVVGLGSGGKLCAAGSSLLSNWVLLESCSP